MSKLRCGNCDHWLGEAPSPLVYVTNIATGEEPSVRPPRDLRLCKSCGQVNVFIAQRDLDARLAAR